MQINYRTTRLLIRTLTLADAAFIFELVNTAGWIKFIGDRNVKTIENAEQYIQKILSNPDITYRVVTITDTQTPIGIVTLIKRKYLEHPDIGFAFLPAHTKMGYAFEATEIIILDLLKNKLHPTLLATTHTENLTSVKLLKKLGFIYCREIINEHEILHLFSVNSECIYTN